MFLSPECLEKLKCSNCKRLLSVFPIFITINDNNELSSICGRCEVPKNGKYSRLEFYEILVRTVHFPCTNKEYGCLKDLLPENVKQHESICPYRKIDCFIDQQNKCNFNGQYSNWLDHCESEHPTLIDKNQFAINLNEQQQLQTILKYRSEVFLCGLTREPQTKYLVCAVKNLGFGDASRTYRIEINLDTGSTTICTKFPEFIPNDIDPKTVNLNVESLAEYNGTVVCSIIIHDDSETNDNELNRKIWENLTCSHCCDSLVPPTFQCPVGHSGCCECKDKPCQKCNPSTDDKLAILNLVDTNSGTATFTLGSSTNTPQTGSIFGASNTNGFISNSKSSTITPVNRPAENNSNSSNSGTATFTLGSSTNTPQAGSIFRAPNTNGFISNSKSSTLTWRAPSVTVANQIPSEKSQNSVFNSVTTSSTTTSTAGAANIFGDRPFGLFATTTTNSTGFPFSFITTTTTGASTSTGTTKFIKQFNSTGFQFNSITTAAAVTVTTTAASTSASTGTNNFTKSLSWLKIPNTTLDNVIKLIDYRCKFIKNGCTYFTKSYLIRNHEQYCLYNSQNCPLKDYIHCDETIYRKNLQQHIFNKHNETVLLPDRKSILIDTKQIVNDFCILKYSNHLFKLIFQYRNRKFYWIMQLIDSSDKINNFKFEIDIIDNNDCRRVLIRERCTNLRSIEDCINNSDCILLTLQQIRDFLIDNILTFRVRILQ